MRGNPQAFENACKAVEHFKAAGVYTCLSLVPPLTCWNLKISRNITI